MKIKYSKAKYGADLTKSIGNSGISPQGIASTAGSVIDALDAGNEYGNQTTGTSIAKNALQLGSLGASFGPVGAGVGALVGAGIGIINSRKDRLEEERIKKQKDVQSRALATNVTRNILNNNPYSFSGERVNMYRMGGLLKFELGGKPPKRNRFLPDDVDASGHKIRKQTNTVESNKIEGTTELEKDQARANAGAQYTRDWIQQREARGDFGLKPSDKFEDKIDNPTLTQGNLTNNPIAIGMTYLVNGVNVNNSVGGYKPGMYGIGTGEVKLRNNKLKNSEIAGVATHETTHQLQNVLGADNLVLPENRAWTQSENVINNEIKRSGLPNDKYFGDPNEVHARVMELRKEAGLKPGQVITDRDIQKMKKNSAYGEMKKVLDDQGIRNVLEKTVLNGQATLSDGTAIGKFGGLMKFALGGNPPRKGSLMSQFGRELMRDPRSSNSPFMYERRERPRINNNYYEGKTTSPFEKPNVETNSSQQSLEEGARFTRDWARKRSEQGFMGLNSRDSTDIRTPTSITREQANSYLQGKTTNSAATNIRPGGFYSRREDRSYIVSDQSPEYQQSASTHEATHDWQKDIERNHRGSLSPIQQSYNNIQREVDRSGRSPNSYFGAPNEIHARVMQGRASLELQPGQVVTQEHIDRLRQSNPQVYKELDRSLDDEGKINSFNRTIKNNQSGKMKVKFARFGGLLNLAIGGPIKNKPMVSDNTRVAKPVTGSMLPTLNGGALNENVLGVAKDVDSAVGLSTINNLVGNPKVKLKNGVRANYDDITNTMEVDLKNGVSDYLAEASHAYQNKYTPEIWKSKVQQKLEPLDSTTYDHFAYDSKGSGEYNAHKQIEPALKHGYSIASGGYGEGQWGKEIKDAMYPQRSDKVYKFGELKKKALGGDIYKVKKGDTLLGIANRTGVNADEIAKMNNISDPNTIGIGQSLKLRQTQEAYKIRRGDTLDSIARRYNTTVDILAKNNKISNPNEIQVGQSLSFDSPTTTTNIVVKPNRIVAKPAGPRVLRDSIGRTESNNNYGATNSHSSATGKYQFLWGQWGDKIKEQTGVRNQREFLRSKKAQEQFYDYYENDQLKPQTQSLRNKYPKQTKKYNDVQLGRLLHFRGYQNARDYVLGKQGNKAESYNMDIDDYMNDYKNGGLLKYALGGHLKPLNSTDSLVKGRSHENGGVKFPEHGIELEGNETKSGDFIFSKVLGYAKKSLPIMKAKGKIEQHLEQNPNDKVAQNSVALLTRNIGNLAAQQEQEKQMLGINSNEQRFALGGPVKPRKIDGKSNEGEYYNDADRKFRNKVGGKQNKNNREVQTPYNKGYEPKGTVKLTDVLPSSLRPFAQNIQNNSGKAKTNILGAMTQINNLNGPGKPKPEVNILPSKPQGKVKVDQNGNADVGEIGSIEIVKKKRDPKDPRNFLPKNDLDRGDEPTPPSAPNRVDKLDIRTPDLLKPKQSTTSNSLLDRVKPLNSEVAEQNQIGRRNIDVLPFVSNTVNAIRRVPGPTAPTLASAEVIPRINLNARRANLDAEFANQERSLEGLSTNQRSAIKGSLLGRKASANNEITDIETRANNDIASRNAYMRNQTNLYNNQLQNKYNDDVTGYKLSKIMNSQDNLTNAVDKAIQIKQDKIDQDNQNQNMQTLSTIFSGPVRKEQLDRLNALGNYTDLNDILTPKKKKK